MAHRQRLQDGEQIPCASTFQSRVDFLEHSGYLRVLSSPSSQKSYQVEKALSIL
ncbi:hypothetical protein HMPREF9374_3105 [Desmospora sp. 8437]|nr:hypothetical protein HMPREF9374_3105 [Desmospora sp. 8437]